MDDFKPVYGAENIPEAGATSITLPDVDVSADRIAAGYQDPKGVKDQLDISAARNKALDQVPQLKAGDAIPQAIRHSYADALISGETLGPDEFSDIYHGSAHPPIDGLAGQLPSHADLTDHAQAILAHAELPLTAEFTRQTKANLADAWAETGLSTHELYTAAVNNPILADALTRPPMPPPALPEPEKQTGTFDPTDPTGEAAIGRAAAPVAQALGERIGKTLAELPEGIKGFPEAARKAVEEHQNQKTLEQRMEASDVKQAIDIALATGGALSVAGTIRGMFQTPAQIAAATAKAEAKEFVQGTIQEQTGLARRQTEQAAAKLEEFRNDINKALPEYRDWVTQGAAGRVGKPIPSIANLLYHIEGRSQGITLDPKSPFAPVADALRDVYEGVRSTIENNYPDTLQSFYDDYYRHMWENPKQADRLVGGGGRMGSGASTQQRILPKMSDGLAAGLTPKILDPIDNTIHYVTGMRNFIAQQETLSLGRAAGYVKYSQSGAPADGWVQLKGRSSEKQFIYQDANGADKIGTQTAYAHPGFAGSYNNWVGKGFYEYPALGKVYDKLLYGANMLTGLKLSMSGYHAFNIAQESAVAGLANGIGQLAHGDLVAGMKDILPSITILPQPVKQFLSGKQLQEQYLGIADHGPDIEKLVDLYARSGGRATGGHQGLIGQDNNMAQAFDLWNPSKWPGIPRSMKNDIAQATRANPDSTNLVSGLLKGGRSAALVPTWIGQTMSGIVKPLFENAIPKIKMAAFADEMSAWLSRNPFATMEAQLKMGGRLQKSMDDRFGELVQDNLFWPRWIKQSLNLATISVGWEFGTLRAFGGAGKDILTGDLLSPRARWLYSFPLTMAIMSSAYQYAKTGNLPTATDTPIHDMISGRTGGTVEYGSVKYPERSQLPGYQKDAEGWYFALHNAPDYSAILPAIGNLAFNKLSPMWRMGYGLTTGKDPFTGNIIHAHPDMAPWMDYANWLIHEASPIGATNETMKGSNMGIGERIMGMRPAGENLTAPEAAAGLQKFLQEKAQKSAQGWEKAHEKKVETPSIATDVTKGIGLQSSEPPPPLKGKKAAVLGNGAGGAETSGPPYQGVYPDTVPQPIPPGSATTGPARARSGTHHSYDEKGNRRY